jgi:hypothetical protein
MPVTRPTGRALLIGSPSCRTAPLNTLQRLGFTCAEVDEPYSAMAELCRRPLVYRAIILSLTSLYREELPLIAAVKRRWPHVDIWLTQTDGRHAALADAMRLGADGLLSEDGLHRTAIAGAPAGGGDYARSAETFTPLSAIPPIDAPAAETPEPDINANEPILTADELRALLAEPPMSLPSEEPE